MCKNWKFPTSIKNAFRIPLKIVFRQEHFLGGYAIRKSWTKDFLVKKIQFKKQFFEFRKKLTILIRIVIHIQWVSNTDKFDVRYMFCLSLHKNKKKSISLRIDCICKYLWIIMLLSRQKCKNTNSISNTVWFRSFTITSYIFRTYHTKHTRGCPSLSEKGIPWFNKYYNESIIFVKLF